MPGSASATRRGLPVAATMLTLVMVPILLGLSWWQFAVRRPWKEHLIAQLEAAQHLPRVTPHDFYRAMIGAADLQYRRAEIDCRPGRVRPYDLRGGTSAGSGDGEGQGGFLVLVDCNDPARPRPPDLVVVAGWTARPDGDRTIDLDTSFTGTLIEHPYGREANRPLFMLIPTTAVAGLLPSRLPVPADLPNNHLSYALQWFAFAVTLAVIYMVYLRHWRRAG